jgi:excisionase family DNA binding protein
MVAFYMTLVDKNGLPHLVACLTTEEVLAYLNVTPRTIYRLIRTGELPAIRVGRQWRFRRSDLDAFVERQRAVSAAVS